MTVLTIAEESDDLSNILSKKTIRVIRPIHECTCRSCHDLANNLHNPYVLKTIYACLNVTSDTKVSSNLSKYFHLKI